MLPDNELEGMLTDLESDRVERKSSFAEKNKVRQAICAFANDLPDYRLPGVLFIGVSDSGAPTNLAITDGLLREISDLRQDGNILPFPTMTVQRRRLRGSDIVVVEVQPSSYPPVRADGRVWIRVGPRRAIATPDEERRLVEKRRALDVSFDQREVQGASLDDLDLERFEKEYLPFAVAPEVLEQNNRPLEQRLQALRLLTRSGMPNTASILIIGKEPRSWVPGAYVQFLRIDGTRLTDPILNQKEIAGTVLDTIRVTEDMLRANISTSADIESGLVEESHPDYPFLALQQLFRNAVIHRTYESTNSPIRIYWFSNRIEIYSPGGLYGIVTRENFGITGATDYRNPLLAEAAKIQGLVQKFGVGIPTSRRQLEMNGNPKPDFVFSENSVLVTIYRRPQ